MKEEYEDITAYLLDLIKEGKWNGQLYKLDYSKRLPDATGKEELK